MEVLTEAVRRHLGSVVEARIRDGQPLAVCTMEMCGGGLNCEMGKLDRLTETGWQGVCLGDRLSASRCNSPYQLHW
jgi:hypothetical protein